MSMDNEPVNEKKEHKAHDSAHTIFALLIILIVTSVLAVASTLYIRFLNHSNVVSLGKSSLNLPLPDKLQQQIDDQAGDASITLTITESDINGLLTAYPNFPLKNPQATITEAGITLKGKYGILNIEVLIVPKLENGKIKYEIKEIKAASVPAPQKVAEAVSGELSDFISGRMPNSKRVYLDALILKTGLIQATGKKQ